MAALNSHNNRIEKKVIVWVEMYDEIRIFKILNSYFCTQPEGSKMLLIRSETLYVSFLK